MPTYTSQPDETNGIDTYIKTDAPSTNYAINPYLVIGEWNGGSSNNHTLIKFDLSTIPSSAKIISATFYLTYSGTEYSSNSRTVQAYRLKRNWVENQATWNVYSTGNSWQTAGGTGADDIEASTIGTYSITATPSGVYSMNLDVALVEEWVKGTFTNNGILLKTDADTDDQVYYHSSSAETSTNRPKLVIEYNLGSHQVIIMA